MSSKDLSYDQILRIPEDGIRSRPLSVLYLLSTMVVALAVSILPLAYLALIGGIGYFTYWHAVVNVGMVSGFWRAIIYALPLFAGPVAIVALIKPLFVRDKFSDTEIEIDAEREPALVGYIELLCQSIGCRAPSQIKVNADINASAALMHGVLGSKLVLRIGMPLVMHLSIRELTGVLAHELGHFNQRFGMRFSYLIRSTNAWFHRISSQDDRFDRWIDNGSQQDYVGWFFLAAKFVIWLSRLVLTLFAVIADMFSGILSRQMEYDADYYEIVTAGSKSFSRTCHRLHVLNAAAQSAYGQLFDSWRNKQLVDDLPLLIKFEADNLPGRVQQAILVHVRNEEGSIFRSHPLDRDRIKRAEALNADSMVTVDAPARRLFANPTALSKEASLIHYRVVINNDIQSHNLISAAKMIGARKRELAEHESLREYLGHASVPDRPIIFDDPHILPPKDPKKTLAQLKSLHDQIGQALPAVRDSYDQYGQAARQLIKVEQASVLCTLDRRFKPAEYGLEERSLNAVNALRNELKEQQRRAQDSLVGYEKAARRRLSCALELLTVDKIQSRIRDGESLLREARELVGILARLRDGFQMLMRLRPNMAQQSILLEEWELDQHNEVVIGMLIDRLNDLYDMVQECRTAFRDVPYPFEHAGGAKTVAAYLVDYMPDLRRPHETALFVRDFAHRFSGLYLRCIARVGYIARHVEKLIGLPPFEYKRPKYLEDDSEEY